MNYLHMSGAGNDFVVMDVRHQNIDLKETAIALCKTTGADGFLALDSSEIADFRLHFYNADGLRGEMCGNGARCICRFGYDLGVCGEEMTVETDAGLVYGRRIDEATYKVKLNLPDILDFHRAEPAIYVELGHPGIPHALLEVTAPPQKNLLLSEALRLRHHSAFPKGANVSFFYVTAPDTVQVLTYERGVEDYTLSCGTGCGSIACALWKAGRLPQKRLLCQNLGGTLTISLETLDKITAIYLEGPTEIL